MKKKRVALKEAEWRLVLQALNELRTSLISQGHYTDVPDEVMAKIIKAPVKKIRAI
jgi:predicted SprT family Zn-dependent metalloprotease